MDTGRVDRPILLREGREIDSVPFAAPQLSSQRGSLAMRWRSLLLVLAIQLCVAMPAPAGIFFHRKEKAPNPAQHLSELLGTVKADPDLHKRVAAAEELRTYDAKVNPEIPAILIDVLQHDDKAEVRAEAAATLGKLRPVGPEVGQALEQALASDKSSKVRWQARTALWHCRLNGYRSPKEEGPPLGTPTNKEPPLANPTPTPTATPPPPVAAKPAPLAPPPTRIAPVPGNWTPAAPAAPPAAQPLPSGPAHPPLVPTEPPPLKSPPPTVDPGGGPSLMPQ